MMYITNFFNLLKKSALLALFEITSRNREKVLGVFWYVLEPLIFFTIIMLLSRQINLPQGEIYPVYLFIGLAFINFFRKATSSALGVFSSSVNYIKNMNISVIPFVLAQVLIAVFMHLFEILILVVMMAYYSIPLYHLFLYAVPFLLFAVFTTGVSVILASANIFVKDMTNIWSVIIRVLWFATPVFYYFNSVSLLSRLNYWFNPLFHYLSSMRSAIKGVMFSSGYNAVGTILVSIAVVFLSTIIFSSLKDKFADHL